MPPAARAASCCSASGRLLRQSAESLAGRVAYIELPPFLAGEVVGSTEGCVDDRARVSSLWLRGGFPRSYLAPSDAESLAWRADFVQTFLARDLPA